MTALESLMSKRNYVTCRTYGGYPVGTVLPEFVVAAAGPVAAQVAAGIVAPTDKPVTVDLKVPEPKTRADPNPDLVAENNRLRGEVTGLFKRAEAAAGQIAHLKRELAARDKRLGELASQVEHLTEACETHQAAAASLRADLESLTAPAGA